MSALKKIKIYNFFFFKTYIVQNPQFLWAATVAATVAATGRPLGGHWAATAERAPAIVKHQWPKLGEQSWTNKAR